MVSPDIRTTLCLALSDRLDAIQWDDLTPADWERLVALARVERVAPLLCYFLRHRGWPPRLPEAARSALLLEFYNSAAQANLFHSELERVLAVFRQRGLDVVLLKGAALVRTVYPDIALRPMGDLDLLVRPEELNRATQAIEAIGYKAETPPMRRGFEHLVFYEANYLGGQFLTVQLELHWNLIGGEGSRYRPDMEWFWRQARSVGLGSNSALVLGPEAHLLHAAAHLVLKHGGDQARLLWLYDLHLLIARHPDLDWMELVQRAEEFSWSAALSSVLAEVRQLFATLVPSWVMDALRLKADLKAQQLLQQIAEPERTRTAGSWTHMRLLSWPARLQWIAAVVFPDPAYMRWRYKPQPAWLWPACYFARWADIARDGMYTLVRRMGIAFPKTRKRSTEAS